MRTKPQEKYFGRAFFIQVLPAFLHSQKGLAHCWSLQKKTTPNGFW